MLGCALESFGSQALARMKCISRQSFSMVLVFIVLIRAGTHGTGCVALLSSNICVFSCECRNCQLVSGSAGRNTVLCPRKAGCQYRSLRHGENEYLRAAGPPGGA